MRAGPRNGVSGLRRGRGRSTGLIAVGLLLVAVVALRGLREPPRHGQPPERPAPGAGPPRPARDPGEGGLRLADLPLRRARVSRVSDGDSIVLVGGERVRYVGIDAPERDEPLRDDATQANRLLVLGREVELRPGGPDSRDRYGRILALVWAPAADGGEPLCVNAELVRRGLASVYISGPEALEAGYLARLLEAQGLAISGRRGIWEPRLARAATLEEPLVATRYRIHRSSCADVQTARPRPIPSLEEELRRGRSLCRSCRPLGGAERKW